MAILTLNKQMETHRRIKHIDIIKFACTNCDYNSSTKGNLEEHVKTHQKEMDACEECDFVPQNEDQMKQHKDIHHKSVPYINCGKCKFNTDARTSLEDHMESIHPEPSKSITCGICSKKLSPQEDLDVHVYTHHKKMFKCGQCEYETEQEEMLKKHVDKHQGSGPCKTCPAFHNMEVKFKLLKDYERLITINKNLQDQAKDKSYVQDVLMAELRNNYDSVKAENVKLNDSLETKHKLWKIWMAKMDGEKEPTASDKATEKAADTITENTVESDPASGEENEEI